MAANGSRLGIRSCHTGQFNTGFRSTEFTLAVSIRDGISVSSDAIAYRSEQFHRYVQLLAPHRDSQSWDRPSFGITEVQPICGRGQQ